mmetsp:Transcript_5723/g.11466  ORF Transcript_5723/g.11466 Transcript_5723/m.11466 type:complete len:205 (+) Transcript_5723:647-1261(+)
MTASLTSAVGANLSSMSPSFFGGGVDASSSGSAVPFPFLSFFPFFPLSLPPLALPGFWPSSASSSPLQRLGPHGTCGVSAILMSVLSPSLKLCSTPLSVTWRKHFIVCTGSGVCKDVAEAFPLSFPFFPLSLPFPPFLLFPPSSSSFSSEVQTGIPMTLLTPQLIVMSSDASTSILGSSSPGSRSIVTSSRMVSELRAEVVLKV